MDRTWYSETVPGDDGNYEWAVRVDCTSGGYVGITQWEGERVTDRVLLTKAQWRAVQRFVCGHLSRQAA